MTFDAIVLCGGAARRLGGADKAAVTIAGRSLWDRALDAVAEAGRIVAVGPTRPAPVDVKWTIEQPRGSGPVAAIAAGLAETAADVVVVLGVDFPFVDAGCVNKIVGASGDHDGAILADATGRHQFLVGAYRREALTRVLAGLEPAGAAVKDLIAGLDLVVLDDPRSTRDCDTWQDVAWVQETMRKGER